MPIHDPESNGPPAETPKERRRRFDHAIKPRMAVRADRGYWGVGLYQPKKQFNVGTLLRNAHAFNAAFCFMVGQRFPRQATDTARAWRHMPIYRYSDMDDLLAHLPYECALIGVELADRAIELPRFTHPERAAYLLGTEDDGLPPDVLARCKHVVCIPNVAHSLNVASVGTVVMYDRAAKRGSRVSGERRP